MERRRLGGILAAVFLCVILCLAGIKASGNRAHYDFDPETAPETVSGMVYIAGSGTKYHKESCGSVTVSDDVRKMTLEDAQEAGYEPCQKCLP